MERQITIKESSLFVFLVELGLLIFLLISIKTDEEKEEKGEVDGQNRRRNAGGNG